jgi:hypothetical protein
VKRGHAYWRGLCAGRLPSRAMIDPAAIPAQVPLATDGKHVDMVLLFVDFPRMR